MDMIVSLRRMIQGAGINVFVRRAAAMHWTCAGFEARHMGLYRPCHIMKHHGPMPNCCVTGEEHAAFARSNDPAELQIEATRVPIVSGFRTP